MSNFTIGNPSNQLQSSLDGVSSAVRNIFQSSQNSTITGQIDSVPWKDIDSRFFKAIAIKPDRWDQLFPYRLMVYNTDPSKGTVGIVNGSRNAKITVASNNKGNAIINFEPLGQQWLFTLPISPQQLTIADQYAINVTATLRGILEEHSGLRFKMINASGTMGVWAYRSSVSKPPTAPTFTQSLFAGTIEAATNVANQFQRVINTATTNHPASKPSANWPEVSDAGPTSTGYYAALALEQFLEQYAEAKKNPKNSGWRLIFDIPKQNQSFVVTPMQFVWQQNANRPKEISYTFQLKAWRRIDLNSPVESTGDVQTLNPLTLQRILNTISEARKLLSASVNLIGAVRSDVDTPLEALRQTSLFVKDLAGAAITAADLPFQIQRDYASTIKDTLNTLSTAISSNSTDPAVRSAMTAIVASTAQVEGLSFSSVSGGQLGQTAAQAQSIDPSNNVFDEPEKNFSLMDQAPLSNITLTPSQQDTIDQIIDDSRETSIADLKQNRAVIQDLAFQLSNIFGAGDAFYNEVYNKPPPYSRVSPMTVDEYEILKALYDSLQSYDIMTATTDIDDLNKQSNMDYVAGLADLSGITFQNSQSKILAPVPFGLTMEAIALRYLGNPQRWLEIATLNNLREPYIDETGFKLSLLSNANGRQITIGTIDNMYIGQRVILNSLTQMSSARTVLNIDRLSDTSFLITLDGPPNLDNFLTADSAYLQIYLPGTVNSQQKIFIPSDLSVPNDPSILVPSATLSDPLTGLSKVDWLMTDTGDIATNNYGDFRFSYGLTNIVQALKLKIATVRGTVLLHPNFGMGIRPGTINSEITVQDIYNTINKSIEDDPRFKGIDNLQISIKGPVLSINMGVALAGQSGVFPINFDLPM